MRDRPSAAELVEAVREFLEHDVLPAVEARVAFHARVAANALGIVERELELGATLDAEEHARLRQLLGRDGSLRELNEELARRIRDGSIDGLAPDVFGHLRRTALGELRIANPGYLDPADRVP